MDSNKLTRNILILLIGISSVILAILFANITFQLSDRRSPDNGSISTIESDTLKVEKPDEGNDLKSDLYETCVLISTDKNIILNNQELLSLNGYPVKIKESKRANKLIYSLIIDKQLSREDAILLGEEIKDKYAEIRSYWIEKVNNEQSEKTPQLQESEESMEPEDEITDTETPEANIEEAVLPPAKQSGTRFEIQIMANTDKDRIEANKKFLEAEGYKMKIVEFVKDGITYYRLRLAAAYSKEEADLIGSEMKQKYKFINSYWLEKLED